MMNCLVQLLKLVERGEECENWRRFGGITDEGMREKKALGGNRLGLKPKRIPVSLRGRSPSVAWAGRRLRRRRCYKFIYSYFASDIV
ncbi:hypothetical protein AAHA92_06780 [Salvia divinorum]|uniref:Uncharacterized protein n=1 Tax=Salvia divinorum TaxID=28513 RepID=A0ABD1I956_SALDI